MMFSMRVCDNVSPLRGSIFLYTLSQGLRPGLTSRRAYGAESWRLQARTIPFDLTLRILHEIRGIYSSMSQEQWTAVDRYITELFVPPDPALDAALHSSDCRGFPSINVSPNQGKLLYLLAQVQRRSEER